MYLINLYPYFARNNPVSYSWIGAVAASKIGFEKIVLIGSKLQLTPPSLQRHNSWISELVREVSDENWSSIVKIEVPDSLLSELYDESGDGLSFLKSIPLTNFNNYINFLLSKISQLSCSMRLIAGISLVNDKSFDTVCSILSLPVIYSEAGPIRLPNFDFGTYYFDFVGVNGKHDFKRVFENASLFLDKNKFLSTAKIIDSLYSDKLFNSLSDDSFQYEIGVALQIEDDSNLISYSNGHDSLQILFKALWVFPKELISIRQHPLAKFSIKTSEFGDLDKSTSACDFILKCKRLITINSSVAFESLLLGRETYILGETPLNVFAQQKLSRVLYYEPPNAVALNNFVNIYFFLYLIPDWFWLNDDYYKFRLSRPSIQDVFDLNLSSYLDRGFFAD